MLFMKPEKFLPENSSDFKDVQYWERAYTESGTQEFEWYVEFEDIQHLLKRTLDEAFTRKQLDDKHTRRLRIFNIGCGTSALPVKISDTLGYDNITNIDYSETAIDSMKKQYCEYTNMNWLKVDIRNKGLERQFGKNSADVILDKGLFDAYLADSSCSETLTHETEQFLESVFYCLSSNGCYVLISLMQPYIMKQLELFIHRCVSEHYSSTDSIQVYPVAINIFPINHKKLGRFLPYYIEIRTHQEKPLRSNPLHLTCNVYDAASTCLITAFKLENLSDRMQDLNRTFQLQRYILEHSPGEERHVSLCQQLSSSPKYFLTIYDKKQHSKEEEGRTNGNTVMILVPYNQEKTWIFSTPKGYECLLLESSAERLVLIRFGTAYENVTSLNAIQNELSAYVRCLCLDENQDRIPIMAVASEKDYQRTQLCCQPSEYADKIYVYESLSEENMSNNSMGFNKKKKKKKKKVFRRVMLFEVQSRCVQSEVKVLYEAKSKPRILFLDSCTDYYASVLASIGLFPDSVIKGFRELNLSCLLVGSGAGILTNILREVLVNVVSCLEITTLEIDPVVVNISRQFFGYPEDCNDKNFCLTTLVKDALTTFPLPKTTAKWSMIILDVNSFNPESALVCPSMDFLEDSVLKGYWDLLHTDGLFIMNLATRCDVTRKQVCDKLLRLSEILAVFTSEHDINRVVVGCKSFSETTEYSKLLETNLGTLSAYRKVNSWVPHSLNSSWSEKLVIVKSDEN